MEKTHDDTVMNFGPNLFGGQGSFASTPSADNGGATNDDLEDAVSVSNQMIACCTGEKTDEATVGQSGDNSTHSSSSVAPGRQGATQSKSGKSEVGTKALSSAKAAVKVFESINGFDEQSVTQRAVVRDLLLKQSEAMEFKLQGKKPPEGEDFDSIAKLLRRENNRLDSLLEGKESLFGKARKAAEVAIESMQDVITEINRLEEEG
ncbi:hypothetical protein ACM7JD_26245 [Pseudomonas aeruginosa]